MRGGWPLLLLVRIFLPPRLRCGDVLLIVVATIACLAHHLGLRLQPLVVVVVVVVRG
jgi:hypothetical protein